MVGSMTPREGGGHGHKKRMKRKGSRRDKVEMEEEVVQCTFAGNAFQGSIARSTMGGWTLDSHTTDAKYTWQTSGIRYEGQIVSSSLQGHGRFLWPDGSKYEGEVLAGKRHGYGVFTAADGVVTYVGEWSKGLRHGRGRLSCDHTGEAFYEGDWLEGEKHGDGKQVWPSGNSYEGQWSRGSKSGLGTMTWKQTAAANGSSANGTETYTGHWQHDSPHGHGCYMWLTPPPNKKDALKDIPLVQMNNHYVGEWVQGIRHGKGIFHYASGANYDGMWERGMKHGHGKYTSEDGCVYEGNFENDRMVDTDMERGMLYRDENPIRNKIDITDLELVSSAGSQVTQEVCNLLLRHLPELKQVYCRYRLQLPPSEGDRFMLTSHQLWLYARDHNLITPDCSIGQLDRFIFQGVRHHQETDFQDAMHFRRPLTPRQPSVHRKGSKLGSHHSMTKAFSRMPTSRIDTSPLHAKKGTLKLDELQLDGITEGIEGEDDGAEDEAQEGEAAGSERTYGSSEYTGTESQSSSTHTSRRQTRVETELEVPDAVGAEEPQPVEEAVEGTDAGEPSEKDDSPRHERRTTHMTKQPFTLFSHFWRPESSEKLRDIHEPKRTLLFRHFLEAIVRMSVARFPHELGLDVRVRALVKTLLLPCAGPKRSSVQCMTFVADVALQEVLARHQPLLWQVFKYCAVGAGSYDTPQWIPPEVVVKQEGENVKSVVDLIPRETRRGWGGQARRAHCDARLDVTMRIKDLLRLLSRLGLVRPPSLDTNALADGRSERVVQTSTIGAEANAPRHLLFADLVAGSAEVEDDVVDIAPAAESRAASPMAGRAMGATMVLEEAERERPSDDSPTSLPATLQPSSDALERSRLGSNGGTTPKAQTVSMSQSLPDATEEIPFTFTRQETEGTATQDAAMGAELLAGENEVDASLDMRDIFRILAETLSPASLQKLRWTMSSIGFEPTSGMVSVLEWVETELTFPEFQRFLVRMVEMTMHEQAPPPQMLPQKLHDFLASVLLPAVKQAFAPLASKTVAVGSDAAQDEERGEAAVATQPPAEDTAKLNGSASSTALQQGAPVALLTQPLEIETNFEPIVHPPELWHGYYGASVGKEEVEEETAKLAKRVWPASYAADVADW